MCVCLYVCARACVCVCVCVSIGVDSVASCIKYCLLPSREHDTLNHPRPAHRLDAATCGLVVCGKTRRALAALSAQFKERSMDKWGVYAYCCGTL